MTPSSREGIRALGGPIVLGTKTVKQKLNSICLPKGLESCFVSASAGFVSCFLSEPKAILLMLKEETTSPEDKGSIRSLSP